MELKMIIEHYKEKLPKKPYRTNQKGFLGIAKKEMAIKSKLLQHNQPCLIHWIVLDCDTEYAVEVAQEKHILIPIPNFVVYNTENWHSHLFFGLQDPVCKSFNARQKPLHYLACINYSLNNMFDGDMSYGGLISKNPLHKSHKTQILNNKLWKLNDFKEYLRIPTSLPKKQEVMGLGRNCTIFDTVRKWAYKQVLAYRIAGGRASFYQAVLKHCEHINNGFPVPLHYSELRGIAKSISNWVFDKYTSRMSDDEFSKLQAERGRKSGEKRLFLNQDKREQARELYNNGIKQAEIAKILNVTQQSISNWLKT